MPVDGSSNAMGQYGNKTLEAFKAAAASNNAEISMEAESSEIDMKAALADTVNPNAAKMEKKRKANPSAKSRVNKKAKTDEGAPRMLPIEHIKDQAGQFQKRNPELRADVLTLLRQYIKPGDSKEEILKKLREFFSDPSLADEALEFLIETTDGTLNQECQEAKNVLNQDEGREIVAGRNISVIARAAADKGGVGQLGQPTDLRNLYRDITGNPRDSNTLFDELSRKYAFQNLKKVTKFLLHSMGKELSSNGPSIPAGLLHTLMGEIRSLQAILGVYRFFNDRMNLVNSEFSRQGVQVPQALNFESMAKEFMSLVSERYPTADKVGDKASKLGVQDTTEGKITTFSQFRDAVNQVAAGKVYRNPQHKIDLYMAIIEHLENLEDELDLEIEASGIGEVEDHDEPISIANNTAAASDEDSETDEEDF